MTDEQSAAAPPQPPMDISALEALFSQGHFAAAIDHGAAFLAQNPAFLDLFGALFAPVGFAPSNQNQIDQLHRFEHNYPVIAHLFC
jgi:hypothetical protein